MDDEQLRALLQSGQITPSQYEMFIQQMNISGRGMDTPQERDSLMQQGLLGQQMGSVPMPQEFEPMMPMPSASPSKMIMSPMPEISGRGAPTQNETNFLGQFVDNAKKAMGGRPNVDTPQQRDYLQNIMQDYNKRY